jgi:hypothetical protein
MRYEQVTACFRGRARGMQLSFLPHGCCCALDHRTRGLNDTERDSHHANWNRFSYVIIEIEGVATHGAAEWGGGVGNVGVGRIGGLRKALVKKRVRLELKVLGSRFVTCVTRMPLPVSA